MEENADNLLALNGVATCMSGDQQRPSELLVETFRAKIFAIFFPTGTLLSFMVLYAAIYCSFGIASPFMPSFVASRGAPPEAIGLIFALASGVRLISAPLVARIADRTNSLRLTLALSAVASAGVGSVYLWVSGLSALFAVALLHAVSLAPITNLADALVLQTARTRARFEYGWVRGAGSAAFVAGSMLSGVVVAAYGLDGIIWSQLVFLLMVAAALLLIERPRSVVLTQPQRSNGGLSALLRVRDFWRVVIVAALIFGSHAMHDTFAVIRWSAAGISPRMITVLWSVAVASEVVVFIAIGPSLLRLLSPATCMVIAAGAGALRWTVAAVTVDVANLLMIQPLHGITFALLHLACMRLLARIVTNNLAATAISIYGTVGAGLASALLTLLSGWLYAQRGAEGFLVMSLLCLAAIPTALALRRIPDDTKEDCQVERPVG